MDPSRTSNDTRRSRRRRRTAIAFCAAALLAVGGMLAIAGCGDTQSSDASAAGQGAGQSRQIMIEVGTGDVVKSVAGQLEITAVGDDAQATVTVQGDDADQVAAGQAVTAMVGGRGGGTAPSPGTDTSPPSGEQMQPPDDLGEGNGQGGGQGQPRGMGSGGMGPGGVEGVVTVVESGDDGVAVATVTLESLPDGTEVGDQGMATIQIEVLAEDVLVVPTQALTKDGDTVTVQVLADGQTEAREVEIGAQGDRMTEVVAGLSAGDQIVYEVEFRGQPGDGQPGGGQAPGEAPPDGGQMGSPPPMEQTGT